VSGRVNPAGDFSTRELVGMIEGDKVTLRSVDQRPGDSITFIFAGTRRMAPSQGRFTSANT
jgi:hypothetical protein